MLKYDYINKEWIVSRTARRVYRASAMLSLLVFPVLWVAISGSGMLDPLRPILRPLLLIGVIGTALTGLGMEYFLLRFDKSHPLKQVFWFCLLLVPPIGPALYTFLVYSRSEAVTSCVNRPPKVSA